MDDTLAQAAQASGDLNQLYLAILPISEYHLRYLCGCKGIRLSEHRFTEIVHDATVIFIEDNYLKKNIVVRYFYPMVLYSVKTALWGRKRGVHSKERIHQQNNQSLGETDIPTVDMELPEDRKDYFLDILTEHSESKMILYHLWKQRYYKTAILKIEAITGRAWIYERAEKLYLIWKTLNGKPL